MTRDRIAAWLPGLALLVAGLAWAWPGLLAPLAGAVVPLLACVMIGWQIERIHHKSAPLTEVETGEKGRIVR